MKSPLWVRITSCILAAVLCIPAVFGAAVPASADGLPELASEAAVLIDADTGQVLFGKNMNQIMYPASITKIMTGLLALEALEPDQVLTVSNEAVWAVPRTSSHVDLEPGEELTTRQAMYALALMSANDAANVLAEAVSGSLEAFGRLMTEKAQSLGARNTNFTNANGLPDDNHYTTAYDMALITAAALKISGFSDYFSATSYTMDATNRSEARSFSNKNRMLFGAYRYDGILMSKTGWTSSAQGTLVTAARRGDTTLVAVVLKSVMTESKYIDTWALLNYGFSQYTRVTFSGEELAEKLPLGSYVPMSGQQFSWMLPVQDDTADLHFSLSEDARLSGETGQTAVIVSAAIGDLVLPDIVMILLYQPPAPTVAAQTEETLPETQAEEEPPAYTLSAAAVGCIAAVLWCAAAAVWILSLRRRRRKENKRLLERKLRIFKKQLEQ